VKIAVDGLEKGDGEEGTDVVHNNRGELRKGCDVNEFFKSP
jgi:hypothetical protein